MPIKRHEGLKPLSRDHHHGLLLCFKIREGLKKKVELKRMKDYNDFFFQSQLVPHFEFEEKYVFPLLENEHEIVQQALSEHKRLRMLFKEENPTAETFQKIERELNAHIRFEERELFNEIQQHTNNETLMLISEKEDQIETPDPDDWHNPFWLKQKK